MLTAEEIRTRLKALLETHQCWPEVEQYSGKSKAEIEALLQPSARFTTTSLSALCDGLAINEYDLVHGVDVVPAATAWRRNLDRHGVAYQVSPADTLSKLLVDLEPEQWCALCMVGGAYCLGNSSVVAVITMQDTVNSIFRAGGWATAQELRDLAECSRQLSGEADSPFHRPELLERWHDYHCSPLNPWERLGCLYLLAADHLEVRGAVSVAADQKIVITIHPASPESCVGCELLRGIRSAPCLAGFHPGYEIGQVARPQQCREATETSKLIALHLETR